MSVIEITIEQPNFDENRYQYSDVKEMFYLTPYKFSPTVKGYTGAYGWVNESYQNSKMHLDAFYLTERQCRLGDTKKGFLCGALYRRNQDHKMIVIDYTVMEQMEGYNLFCLPSKWWQQLSDLFTPLSTEEKWLGAHQATELLQHYILENQHNIVMPSRTSTTDRRRELHTLKNQH